MDICRIGLIGAGNVGRRHAQVLRSFPDVHLAGITDPPFVHAPDFFARWLAAARGRFVELSCHPGHLDLTLDGRDGTVADGHIHRRPHELELLRQSGFLDAVRAAGFEVVTAAEFVRRTGGSAAAVRQAG